MKLLVKQQSIKSTSPKFKNLQMFLVSYWLIIDKVHKSKHRAHVCVCVCVPIQTAYFNIGFW